MPSLVTDMGHQKKPWHDVPIEVLIEYERKRREQLEDHREQLRLPLCPPSFPNQKPLSEDNSTEDYKIVIDFI